MIASGSLAASRPTEAASSSDVGGARAARVEQRAPSAFRLVEKRYKSRKPPEDQSLTHTQARRLRQSGSTGTSWRPSLADVWDPRSLIPADRSDNGAWGNAGRGDVASFQVGLDGRRAWAVKDVPGLVVLPAYFTPDEQRELVTSCLVKHTQPPNQNNLDQHYVLPEPPATLWSLYAAAVSGPDDSAEKRSEAVILPRHATLTEVDARKYARMPHGRVFVQNTPGEQLTAAEITQTGTQLPEPSRTARPTGITKLLKELRWTNIGLFYDWSSKNYNFRDRIPFPADLRASLPKIVKSEIDWALVYGDLPEEVRASVGWENWATTYELDAGIINFYQTTDSLMAHVDRSELDPYRPLISVSLGLSAVFLLGGTTRDEPPLPILLRSGDVVVLSGPSRRAYHGVPRVLDGTLPAHFLTASAAADSAWDPALVKYLQTTRINVNSRQVFPPGFDPEFILQQSLAS